MRLIDADKLIEDYTQPFADSYGKSCAEMFVGVVKQTPTVEIIEELEKIKEEIGEEFVDLQDGSEEWRSYVNDAVLSCYEILEKHISELSEEAEEKFNKDNKQGVLKQIAEEQKTLLDSTKAWSNYIDKNGNIY